MADQVIQLGEDLCMACITPAGDVILVDGQNQIWLDSPSTDHTGKPFCEHPARALAIWLLDHGYGPDVKE